MTSVAFPTLPLPATPSLPVAPVAAAAPTVAASLLAGGADSPPLPFSQTQTVLAGAAAQAAPESGAEGAAMRPDQAVLARQLAYPPMDGAGLARNWRSQVRGQGSQLTSRALAASTGQMAPALLAAAQQGQVVRQHELLTNHPDAWRFTVHGSGTTAQHLEVLARDPDKPPGRRRRARAALRLELQLEDGNTVVAEVEPLPQGVAIALCAEQATTLTRLRWLQPKLEQVMQKAGVKVLGWTFRDRLPAGRSHLSLANAEQAAQALNLEVFRTVAELALVLPAQAAQQRSGGA